MFGRNHDVDEIDERREVIEMLEMDSGTRPCGDVCCV
jgi:hypothetical protein